MGRLYIRNKDKAANCIFVHTPTELLEVIDMYIPGRNIIIGDPAQFNGPMRSMLLKLIEENPNIDVYSSIDNGDSVLYSRFTEIIKEPISIRPSSSVDDFFKSPRSYQDAQMYLSNYSNDKKLLAPLLSQRIFKLIQ